MPKTSRSKPDRRTHRRYPIELAIDYDLPGKHTGQVGKGRTVNISTKGVNFTVESKLPEGVRLELTVEWPALLHDSVALKLVLYGVVTYADQYVAAIAIKRYEFRTRSCAASASN